MALEISENLKYNIYNIPIFKMNRKGSIYEQLRRGFDFSKENSGKSGT